MTADEILEYLNNTKKPDERKRKILARWTDLYFGISLHTSGAVPAFKDLSNKPMVIPSVSSNAAPYNSGYSNYLSSLTSIGFQYDGYWVFPPNFQGWEYHFVFDKYIFSRHPREAEDTRQWRFSQYVPVTQAPCGQLNEVVTGAIFQDSNYTVEVEDKEDNDYIWGNNFDGFDLIGYISNIGYKYIIEDANGFIVRLPKYAYYEQPKEGRIEVDIKFILSKNIRYIDNPINPTEIIFISDDTGWYIDRNTIWRFVYSYDERKYILSDNDKQGYYAHKFGKLPITKAGGIWNTHGYFESYYYKAKALMDDYIRSYSARQLIDKEASTPIIIEPDTECPTCNGKGQIQVTCDTCPNGLDLQDCGTCYGAGTISRNPGERMVMSKEEYKAGVDVKFVNPDVAVNKNMRETCIEIMNGILDAMHLKKVEEAQSGVAKAIDQERLYKFISTISNDLFDKIIPDTLQDIIAYRNVRADGSDIKPDNKAYIVKKPSEFNINTYADLLIEYQTASQSNLPIFMLQKLALDMLDKEYGADEIYKKKGTYIVCYDPLSIKANSVSTPEQQVYNLMLPIWLDEIVKTKGNEWFLLAKDNDIKAEVELLETAYYVDNPTSGKEDDTKTVDVNKTVTE